ncbi:unnamed protein product, partial [Didymodactylos carnosus]
FSSPAVAGQPGLFNHPGLNSPDLNSSRAALISGPKRQYVTNNRAVTSSTSAASSPTLNHITTRTYSLSRALSESKPMDTETSNNGTNRKPSLTEYGEKSQSQLRRSSGKSFYYLVKVFQFRFIVLDGLATTISPSSQRSNSIKSLTPAYEAPVNLLEQLNIREKPTVQILSPHYERVSKS